jgi:transposase
MPKQAIIEIKEDLDYLKNLRKKEKNHRLKTRIQSLILTKEKKFKRRVDLANHLGIGIASLDRWTRVYTESGLESMLTISNGGARRNCIPQEVHEGLAEKVYDSNAPFLGYWDAVDWVRQEYGLNLKYNTLRTYLIRHFNTKLKSPRKSHYKKDEQAIQAFKKTTEPAKRH